MNKTILTGDFLTKEAQKALKKLMESTGHPPGQIISNLIENLALNAEHPKERTWSSWTLHEETIQAIAKKYSLSLEGRDLDEIARQVEKGIAWGLDDIWENVIRDAIRNTAQEETEGQDREGYTDTQDRKGYVEEEKPQ